MKYAILIFFVVLVFTTGRSQQANHWYFPEKAGIVFENGVPKGVKGGKISTPDPNNLSIRPTESGACISDRNGNLLFYTDGITVWDRNHSPMTNGTDLMGGPSATQPAVIVPDPGNPSRYYIFTVDDFQNILQNGFRYSIVDMCMNNGMGDVTSEKNILLLDTVTEKQAITKHQNDTDYWVVVHKHFSDAFYAYLVTKDGIQSPVITKIGSAHTGGIFAGTASAVGQMKISPDGSKIALVNANTQTDNALIEVFDFNNQTGVLSNYTNLSSVFVSSGNPGGFFGGYGLSFSPNSKSIYVISRSGILQFQQNPYWSYITRIFLGLSAYNPAGGAQLAPNGKIYIAKGESFLSSFIYPDSACPACGFTLDDVFLNGNIATWSLPSFYDGFNYTPTVPDCPPVYTEPSGCETLISPNPVRNLLTIRAGTTVKEIYVYNTFGQIVRHFVNINAHNFTIDMSNLNDACYILSVTCQNESRCKMKVIKIND